MKTVVNLNQPVLFLDDYGIERGEGLERKMGKPVKHQDNPIFTPQKPWEGICVIMWGSLVWDKTDNQFRMWYEVANPIAPSIPDQTLLCHAVSQDGIHWQRPDTGLYDYQGSRNNNIVYRAEEHFDTPTVIVDPFDPPEEQRFKMVLYDTKRRVFVRFSSPDGLKWNEIGPIDLPVDVGDRHSLMADEESGRWLLYHKCRSQKRTVYAAVSEDFEHWEEMGELLVPDEKDPPETEFYGMVGFRDQGWGLGYLEMFHVLERHLDAQLIRLDESGRPERYARETAFLERGQWGQWDAGWVFPSNNPPVRHGEEMLIYYQGRRTIHWATPSHGGRGHIGAIGLARLRPHGYAYLEAGSGGGSLTTLPFTMSGHHLCVNANAMEGRLTGEILEEEGKVIPGYTASDCFPLSSDATYFKLCWSGRSRLDDLKGRKIRLRLHLKNASIYSYWLSDRLF